MLLAGTVPPFVLLLIYLDYLNFKGLLYKLKGVVEHAFGYPNVDI